MDVSSGLKRTLVLVGVLVAAALVAGGLYWYVAHKPSRPAQSASSKQALAEAKKTLAADPHNTEAIVQIAYLYQAQGDTGEAKKYFNLAFEEYKKQENPDASGKPIGVYWAAAQMAEQAGQTSQAKKYYQTVIDVAKQSDSYEKSLAAQSQDALKRLK